METPSRPYSDNSLFTFGIRDHQVDPMFVGPSEPAGGYEQFDVAIVEFDDEGRFVNGSQLEALSRRVKEARRENQEGAIVVCFIHGWHNTADWNNPNFVSFRRLVKALMWREMEALHRRVIGVYLGWSGKQEDGIGKWIGRIPIAKNATFSNRYDTAGDIGRSEDLSSCLVDLTAACKDDTGGNQAPLILIGHSMGALILQSAIRELLRNPHEPLIRPAAMPGPVTISTDSGGQLAMPDLLLSINSAAENEVAHDIIASIQEKHLYKRFIPPNDGTLVQPYDPPLLISMTSTKDLATDVLWEIAHGLTKPSTDGHDLALVTHRFEPSNVPTHCPKIDDVPDYGQPWHCLHKDARPDPTPRFRIDLPDHDRSSGQDLTHTAYDLIPNEPQVGKPFWFFKVPGEIISNHSDVFNYQAASLVLALIQTSGVLASAAGTRWTENFSEIDLSGGTRGEA